MDDIILKASAQGETNPMKLMIESYLDSIESLNLNYDTKFIQNETFDENNNAKKIDHKNYIVKATLPKFLIEDERYKNFSVYFSTLIQMLKLLKEIKNNK